MHKRYPIAIQMGVSYLAILEQTRNITSEDTIKDIVAALSGILVNGLNSLSLRDPDVVIQTSYTVGNQSYCNWRDGHFTYQAKGDGEHWRIFQAVYGCCYLFLALRNLTFVHKPLNCLGADHAGYCTPYTYLNHVLCTGMIQHLTSSNVIPLLHSSFIDLLTCQKLYLSGCWISRVQNNY
jgi:hypothetical protein